MSTATMIEKYNPVGVWPMFFMQALAMVGYSIIASLLVLYCTNILGMSESKAYALNGAFHGLVFSLSVPGAYLAEKYLGYRFSVFLSFILAFIGLLIMMVHALAAFYFGMAVFLIANATFIPCSFVLLSRLYHKHDQRRDVGFTISYIGMSVGSFFASFFAGYLSDYLGYSASFFIGGLLSLYGAFIFYRCHKTFCKKGDDNSNARKKSDVLRRKQYGLIYLVISFFVATVLLYFFYLCNILMLFFAFISFLFILYLAKCESGESRKNLLVFFVLNMIGAIYWALATFKTSVLVIFIENNVDRYFAGFHIPTASYYSLNPIFIIIFGGLLAFFFSKYFKEREETSTIIFQFSVGLVLMGLGLIILIPAIAYHNDYGKIFTIWIIGSYFLQALGELFIGPIGYSMVGKLVPPNFEGIMIGIWHLITGSGSALSVYMANMTISDNLSENPVLTNPIYQHFFSTIGIITVIIALLILLIIPMLKSAWIKIG